MSVNGEKNKIERVAFESKGSYVALFYNGSHHGKSSKASRIILKAISLTDVIDEINGLENNTNLDLGCCYWVLDA